VLATGLVLIACGLLAGWCAARISFRLPDNTEPAKARRYWILPLAYGAISAASVLWSSYHQYGVTAAVLTALLGWQLALLAIVDAENFWLPDILTIPLAVTGVLASVLLVPPLGQGWVMSLVSAALGFAGLWLLALLYQLLRKRKGMGAGDPILLGAGCAWVGIADVLTVLLWSSLSALCVIGYLRLRQHNIDFATRIPFGTFLALGIWMSWLF